MKLMNNIPVLNRANSLPDDGWYHVCPCGEFSVRTADGKKLMQVIDDRAVKAMADRLIADGGPLLVDYDHFSYDSERSSEAAGWITELDAREDGLWAKIDWTDTGSAAVMNKRYRFVSPVWYPDECEAVANGKIRPLRLDSIALTNSPNLKGMRPLSNRGTEDESLNNRAEEEGKQMKELITLLGLTAEATAEAIVNSVTALKTSAAEAIALKNRAETAETKVAAMEKTQLEADADAFCDTHAAVILNRDQVKAQFIANRAGTEALFGSIKPAVEAKATEKAPIHNRQKAGENDEPDAAANAKAAAIRNRASEIMTQRKCTWGVAFDAAKSEVEKV